MPSKSKLRSDPAYRRRVNIRKLLALPEGANDIIGLMIGGLWGSTYDEVVRFILVSWLHQNIDKIDVTTGDRRRRIEEDDYRRNMEAIDRGTRG